MGAQEINFKDLCCCFLLGLAVVLWCEISFKVSPHLPTTRSLETGLNSSCEEASLHVFINLQKKTKRDYRMKHPIKKADYKGL